MNLRAGVSARGLCPQEDAMIKVKAISLNASGGRLDHDEHHSAVAPRGGGVRVLSVLLAALVFVACKTAPVVRSEPQASSPTQAGAPEPRKAPPDSVLQFLLTSAATDFHTHPRTTPVRFRDVRMGHVTDPNGEKQYMLCGQFLPSEGGDKAEWTPFVTIKTSGYEQWIGAQAAVFCERSSVLWDEEGDLSSALQSRLDALR
jgi:hypothetical protein